MVDNDQNNDEFKFNEYDSLNDPGMGTMGPGDDGPNFGSSEQPPEKRDVKKNALIVLGIVVILMVSYKVISFMFFSTPKEVKPAIPPLVQTPKKVIPPPQVQPVTPPVVVGPTVTETALSQKVSAIELSQDIVKSQVNSVNDKVNVVSDSVSNLNAQITKLNQAIEALSQQVTKQSNEINMLTARLRSQRAKPIARVRVERIAYYIQAVIPGRAWLIATNGSTLTVGVGSKIPGYGIVKLIDSVQGKVITSSGRIIRFSQEDS